MHRTGAVVIGTEHAAPVGRLPPAPLGAVPTLAPRAPTAERASQRAPLAASSWALRRFCAVLLVIGPPVDGLPPIVVMSTDRVAVLRSGLWRTTPAHRPVGTRRT